MGWPYKSGGRSPPTVFDTDHTQWTSSTWVLYALGALFLVGFLWFWVRFAALERAAKRQGGDAVLRYNGAIRGFPNAVYAKMFGKRAFEVKGEPPAKSGP